MPASTTPVVLLTAAERDWAFQIGLARFLADEQIDDAPYYKDQKKKRYDDLTGNVVSLLGEMAAARFLDRYFDGAVWQAGEIRHKKKRFADVGGDIEVRHVVEPNAGMVVRQHELTTGRQVLLVYPDKSAARTRVTMIGTLPAMEAWDRGEPQQDYRRCPQRFLRPADTLLVTHPRPEPVTLDVDQLRNEWNRLERWERDWVNLAVYNALAERPEEPVETLQRAAAEALIIAKVNDRYWHP